MSVLESVRGWLRTQCPLIDGQNKFNVNYLSDRAVSYTLTAAGEAHREDILGRDIVTYNLIFAARMPYGAALEGNLGAAELFSELSAWIREQHRLKQYPLVEGYRCENMVVANSGMIIQTDANTAQYQIQIQMTFEEA